MFKRYLLALAIVIAVAIPLSAREITFTFTGTGSGRMQRLEESFPFTTWKIVGIADTSDIQYVDGVYSLDLAVSTFQGSGDAYPFGNIMRVFSHDDVFGFGFSLDWNYDLMAPHSPAFVGYKLDSNIPATFSSDIDLTDRFQWIASEDGGGIVFDSLPSVTASAQLSPVSDSQVPEPASIALLATGLLGSACAARRRFALR